MAELVNFIAVMLLIVMGGIGWAMASRAHDKNVLLRQENARLRDLKGSLQNTIDVISEHHTRLLRKNEDLRDKLIAALKPTEMAQTGDQGSRAQVLAQ